MLDKFSKNLLGLILQYLDGHEILRCEQVCKKIYPGTQQEYIWRYLTENKLEIATKLFLDSWKQCYWRNHNASIHMTPKNLRYQMCPIRHFKNLIKYIDSYNNFIFAADDQGNVGVFLINEKDLENDNETLQTFSIQTEGVEYLKYLKSSSELMIVTTNGVILVFSVQQQSHDKFTCELKDKIELQIKASNLYVTQLDESGQQFFISNLPISGEDFNQDQTIVIFNPQTMKIVIRQTLDFSDDPQDPFQNMNLFKRQDQWGNINLQQQDFSLNTIKEEKNKFQLAVFNGSKLIFSYFNKCLVVVETQMSKVEMFMKKGNYRQVEIFGQNTPIAINLLSYKGILIANNLYELNILDYQTLQLLQTIKFGLQIRSLFTINHNTDELSILKNIRNQMQLIKYKIDFKSQKLEQIYETTVNESNQINDLDMNNHLFCSATTEGNIKLRLQADPKLDPFFINAGSKTIKTYIQHPRKPGVSIVRAEQSKIIAVLGNIMRVYSFDVQGKKK